MKAIYNNEIISDVEPRMTVHDRAFQYGDGVFETVIFRDNHVNLLEYHYKRLAEGAAVLCFDLPEYLSVDYLKESFRQLQNFNQIEGPLRFKVQAWRFTGGFYEPESTMSNLLITVQKHSQRDNPLKNVGISNRIRNHWSPFSQFKTLNSLSYIVASLERKGSNHDDLIILDQEGYISELLYSNIFWFRDDIFYTPSLSTGCIRGVMRSHILDQLKLKGYPSMEVQAYPEDLGKSTHIFAANSAGITHITGFNGNNYTIFQKLEGIINL